MNASPKFGHRHPVTVICKLISVFIYILKGFSIQSTQVPSGSMVPVSIWSSIAKRGAYHFWFLFQCGVKLQNREPATSVV